MATAVVASGCDFLGTPAGYSDEGSVIAAKAYGGFTDPAGDISDGRANTDMTFCCRYLIRPGAGTGLINGSELTNLNNAGVQVVFICENVNIQSPTAFSGPTAAYNQGQSDGTAAQNALQALIGTPNWVVYYAADYDFTGALGDYFPNYVQGVASVVGASHVGIYGDGTLWTQVGPAGSGYATFFWQSRSAGWSGNGAIVAGQNLWQWPIITGYNPSGNVTLTGSWGSAAVDGDVAITANYGQYPGSGGTGSLSTATITNPTMTYTQPSKQTIEVPSNSYDQVLYSNVWSTSVTASSWPQSLSAPATNINQYAYAVGNFHAVVNGNDVGINDFGVFNQGLGGYGQFPGNLPTCFVQPFINSSGALSFEVTYTPGGSATISLTLNYALLAYPNASVAPVQSNLRATGYANAFLGGGPQVYSTYRRIAIDSSVGTGSSTIAHGQGTIPNLFFWVTDNSGNLEVQSSTWTSAGLLNNHFGIAMDATKAYIYVDSVNNTTCWYRIYKDN